MANCFVMFYTNDLADGLLLKQSTNLPLLHINHFIVFHSRVYRQKIMYDMIH